jgi:hypothetical protein
MPLVEHLEEAASRPRIEVADLAPSACQTPSATADGTSTLAW